jgi:hypothetical protein
MYESSGAYENRFAILPRLGHRCGQCTCGRSGSRDIADSHEAAQKQWTLALAPSNSTSLSTSDRLNRMEAEERVLI